MSHCDDMLVSAVIHSGRVSFNCIVSHDADGMPVVNPFSAETHSTTFVNGVAVITDATTAERLRRDTELHRLVASTGSIAAAVECVINRIENHAADSVMADTVVVIPRT